MSKTRKRLLLTAGILLLIFLLGYGIGTVVIRAKIDAAISEALPNEYALEYQKSEFNLWTATYALQQPTLRINDSAAQPVLKVSLEKVRLQGIDYWGYLVKDAIRIKNLRLDQPQLQYYSARSFPTSDSGKKKSTKTFQIKNVQLNNATIEVLQEADSLKMYLANVSAAINNIAPIQKKIPSYDEVSFSSDSLFVQLNAFDQLTLNNIQLEDAQLRLDEFRITTQGSEADLSKASPKEKDHYDIVIPKLTFNGFKARHQATSWGVYARSLRLSQPDIKIYRDKRLPDDTSFKPMFGQLLRELSFPLGIDSVDVENLKLIYREKITTSEPPGEVTFSNFQAAIANVGNTYPDSTQTRIDVTTHIFKNTSIDALWTFRVQDTLDRFTFECEAGAFQSQVMNSFTIPSSRMALEGRINKTYFTITGDDDQGHINLKTNFKNFRIRMLEEEGRDTKEITNLLANAVVNKESSDEEDNFKEGKATTARVKNKSAFNYIWINIMAGLRKAILDHNDDDD
ncbi:hypothetical protein [Altibacter sp. HG106]|uniref:hypothetical protein n=1 Tax=Altibacter sp. HG106 TaxID=3023937 RepID=UPI00234FFFCD|nr:hypothetical protein [Altibacter sp. HG106]MDC7994323.1 hypothetical protein [Altibacter sp. HG106]